MITVLFKLFALLLIDNIFGQSIETLQTNSITATTSQQLPSFAPLDTDYVNNIDCTVAWTVDADEQNILGDLVRATKNVYGQWDFSKITEDNQFWLMRTNSKSSQFTTLKNDSQKVSFKETRITTDGNEINIEYGNCVEVVTENMNILQTQNLQPVYLDGYNEPTYLPEGPIYMPPIINPLIPVPVFIGLSLIGWRRNGFFYGRRWMGGSRYSGSSQMFGNNWNHINGMLMRRRYRSRTANIYNGPNFIGTNNIFISNNHRNPALFGSLMRNGGGRHRNIMRGNDRFGGRTSLLAIVKQQNIQRNNKPFPYGNPNLHNRREIGNRHQFQHIISNPLANTKTQRVSPFGIPKTPRNDPSRNIQKPRITKPANGRNMNHIKAQIIRPSRTFALSNRGPRPLRVQTPRGRKANPAIHHPSPARNQPHRLASARHNPHRPAPRRYNPHRSTNKNHKRG